MTFAAPLSPIASLIRPAATAAFATADRVDALLRELKEAVGRDERRRAEEEETDEQKEDLDSVVRSGWVASDPACQYDWPRCGRIP